jgi:hypothetical protein
MQEKIEKRKIKVLSKDKKETIHRDCVIKYFECVCGMPDHALRFNLDDDGECIELYTEVLLAQHTFWKRLWLGVKYILGCERNSGYFGTWVMKEDDIENIQELLERYQQSDRQKL